MYRVIGGVRLMYRKDSVTIEDWLKNSNKALLITGAMLV